VQSVAYFLSGKLDIMTKFASPMAGIYLHIPFCKQACHYCDFHFSTSLQSREALIKALLREAELQKNFFSSGHGSAVLDTLYYGGGTPSLLPADEIKKLMDTLREYFPVSPSAEVTLEANPDDLTGEKIRGLKEAGINRLSIGVQSFRDSDLRFMNRAHNASEAESSVKRAQDAGITNISIDLIYGVPGLDNAGWKYNLEQAFALDVPHLSCYALTVEEKTALSHMIRTGKTVAPDDSQAEAHFLFLAEEAPKHDFIHYEISNLAREGFHSRHNSSYWSGEPYLGLGPSAHSYNGRNRSWNIRNNPLYIQSISSGKIPSETETLTTEQRFNEQVMISLRTKEGIDLEKINHQFGGEYLSHLQKIIPTFNVEWIDSKNGRLALTKKGMLFADHIASALFI
jgi:oxygen-independent coproporphyrinogen-3 oxidase